MASPSPYDRLAATRALVAEIRACRACAGVLPHAPRPVVRLHPDARILVVGQAPGTRVHATGVPFADASGDRLRDWMGIGEDVFYDAARVAIAPAGLCFPGLSPSGGDLPPRPECAPLWSRRILDALPGVELTLLVGGYAHRVGLGVKRGASITDTVADYARHLPKSFPLPHPSWRNTGWMKRHPWFETELLPALRERVASALA